jgi:hypothetical protein
MYNFFNLDNAKTNTTTAIIAINAWMREIINLS